MNHHVKRTLDVRKLSFAPQDWAVETSCMQYGGITPVGLPDAALADLPGPGYSTDSGSCRACEI